MKSLFLQNHGRVAPASPIAVALSGGADSTALCHAISSFQTHRVHALIVDHGLRAESTHEAVQVCKTAQKMGVASATILRWDGVKPTTNIMESARDARYALLRAWCVQNAVPVLALGHHMDDQAETFLFRLSKGTGLDGLSGMAIWTDGAPALWRPLLQYTHDELVAYCRAHELPWVEDPSNANEKYARPRMRNARSVLEREGLTTHRLATTSARIARARLALDTLAGQLHDSARILDTPATFDTKLLFAAPDELSLRVLQRAITSISGTPPRLEALEKLHADLRDAPRGRKFTLGGCILRLNRTAGHLVIMAETPKLKA